MNALPGQLTRDFIVIGAHLSPAESLERIEDANERWVILERTDPRFGELYYVIERERLLYDLGHQRDDDRSLTDALDLHEPDSNDVIYLDGRALNPVHGPGLHFFGRFAPAAVLIEAGQPAGILEPHLAMANGGTRGGDAGSELPQPPADAGGTGGELEGTGSPTAPTLPALIDVTVGAEFPETLAVGERAPLTVLLVAAVQELAGFARTLELAPGEVDIRLSLSPNLRLTQGKASVRTTVPVAAGDERALAYEIEAVREGPARITIRLFQPWRTAEQIGYLPLTPTVTREPVATPPDTLRPSATSYPPSGLPPADLVLYVEEDATGEEDETEVTFKITVLAPPYPHPYEDYECGRMTIANAKAYLHQRFTMIEALQPLSADDIEVASEKLLQEGRQLFQDLVPAEIQSELKEHGHLVRSIQIKTDGQHIPWEMIVLPPSDRFDPPREEEFLAQRYQVTRWTERYSPPRSIRLRRLAFIAPQYDPGRDLQFTGEEVAYLTALVNRGVVVDEVATRTVDVLREVKSGGFDVLHYAGHAAQTVSMTDHSTLELGVREVTVNGVTTRKTDKLEPSDLANRGEIWKERRPLIFLNACQTGRADSALVGLGGWAPRVLGSKAGAFVGTLWSVRDSAGLLFARTFYDALLSGKTFGESAMAARSAVAATGDPSWLAYVVYAHPNSTLTLEG